MSPTLTQAFGHKIKSAAEVLELIGPFPRENKVILCHGVFDIVHPGHLRHLLYAKSHAALLVANLTADLHIEKGKYRPHVPEDLRAANLAAFEMVDYVLIDSNPTPHAHIRKIQPDFFAKGYEYFEGRVHPKTEQEIEVLREYGGEIIFTPGDIVYSSSRLLEMEPPALKYDKLALLMETEGLKFDDLRAALRSMRGKRVHVVGDLIVDSLTQCALIGNQAKTPTMSVLHEQQIDYIGGAGIVSQHMQSAGAEVHLSTVLGHDELQKFVLRGLQEAGVAVHPLIDESRPTTNKNAILVGGYRLLKIDKLDNRSIGEPLLQKLTQQIQGIEVDAVIFSDFRHGIFNRRTIPPLVHAIPESLLKVADSQLASRWGNITEFQGFDLITPNEREARFALGDQDSGIRALASNLYDKADCKHLILKLGDRGVLANRSSDHESLDSFFSLDSFAEHVLDAVGAGDALLAYATLAMLATNSLACATILGSLAAACECEVDGNIPVTLEHLHTRIDAIEQRLNYAHTGSLR